LHGFGSYINLVQPTENQHITDAKMKYQGFHVPSGKNFLYTLPLQAGATAVLFVLGAFMVSPSEVKANASQQKAVAPTLMAQVPVTATVIYVNPATGTDAGAGATIAAPYKTISFALNRATPGTVIQLAVGTYNDTTGEKFPLLLKPGVTLRGDESSKGQAILITGGGFYTSRTFARQDITILADNNTNITGLTVTNPNQRGTAIWVESTNPTINNNTFTGSAREGVFVTGTGNPKIENNVFVQNQGNGISVAKSATGEIRNNLFQNTGFGLAIGGTSSPLVTENQIVQNKVGIYISESARPLLRKNVIQNNTQDGVVVTVNGLPDLGINGSPGGNLIRSNARYDLNNSTKTNRIIAIGNDIDQKRIFGSVDFVAGTVEPPPGQTTGFKDVPAGYWAKGYIEALASQNIIAGFPDGSFKPNEPVTRAQFATIITKALTPPAKRTAIEFGDVSRNFWAYAAIQSAYRSQFVAGYPDGTFKPQQQIPRVQALVSLANGLGLTANNQTVLSFYTDAGQIPNYAVNSVAAATTRQLVINYPTVKQLEPNREATRAEVAAFVYQALVNAGRAPVIPSPYLVKTP
jgi:parallel beta-helix repeat protein